MFLDEGPGISGLFLISPSSPLFFVSLELLTLQVPVGSVTEFSLDESELTFENARMLSVSLQGLNDARTVFDRVSLVYATVVFIVPEQVPTLSYNMLITMGVLLFIAGVFYKYRRTRFKRSG